MKKVLTFIFIFAFITLLSLSAKSSIASSCTNYGGATTYCNDGTSYNNYGGATTYGSDGSSYNNYGGATIYGNDGSSQSNYGGATTYGSDSSTYNNYGGATTYGNDGSTYNDYGGSTTYGSGGGKMIKINGNDSSNQRDYGGSTIYGSNGSSDDIFGDTNTNTYDSNGKSYGNYNGDTTYDSGNETLNSEQRNNVTDQDIQAVIDYNNRGGPTTIGGTTISGPESDKINYTGNCPANSSYNPSTHHCACSYGYKWYGESCFRDTSKSINPNTDSEKVNNQVTNVTTLKTQDKVIVWWNPLTWWDYFFNKSTSTVNNNEIEPTKSIKEEASSPSLEWKEYRSDIGKFTALFPYDVTHSNWMDNTTMKKLGWNGINKIDTFSTTGTNKESFSVWFHQYIDQRNVANKGTLQTSLNNLLNLMKDYKLISSSYSKYSDYDALDYLVFNKAKNKYEKGKFIAVKQNIYQIFVDYEGESFNNADSMKFFDSFRIPV